MNHSWDYDGDPVRAVARTCGLCGAAGRRFRTAAGATRWETRTAPGQPWVSGRMPACPAERKSTYVSVHVLLCARLKSEGIVPAGAALTLEHLPADWRRQPTPEHPSWLAKWDAGDRQRMVFSCCSMRSCAEAPEIRMSGDQVVPVRNGKPAARIPDRALEAARDQLWLSRTGTSLIRVTDVDDDLVSYEKVSGPGRAQGKIRARSLVTSYTEVAR